MIQFDEKTESMIQNWNQTMAQPAGIKLLTTDHGEDSQFVNFAQQLTDLASRITIESRRREKGLPAFLLKENIRYSALPLEKGLPPFLEALSGISSPEPEHSFPPLSGPVQQALDEIDIPVRLKLYIALGCPHCPNVVRTVIPLALHCNNIDLHIIDGSLFPETAQKDAVMSAPCLILDDDFRWTGSVEAGEILQMIIRRDPSQLSAGTLKNILEQGDASWIVRQMIKKSVIFDGFIKLLLHETWSVRLGAMVVVEELAETDPDLALQLSSILIPLFDGKDVTVQGDILYALGETGNRETKKWISKKISGLSHQDLVDAAKDALETLELKEA